MTPDAVRHAVLAALERERALNLHRNPITVECGDEIRLSGVVDNIAAKRKAVLITRRVSASTRIVDRLRVAVSRTRQNAELRQAVVLNYMHEPAFAEIRLIEGGNAPEDAGSWIGTEAGDGVVKLHGVVGSLSHRRLAEVLAWWTPGTADVDNRLRVYPPEQDNDDEIADIIRIVLDKERAIDAEQVGVRVRNRAVTLTGQLPTEEAKLLAAYDCWYIPGIREVNNNITVS